MARPFDHPNDLGRWRVLETTLSATLWRRDRDDPFPVALFYLLSPPHQLQILYDEAEARARFETLAARTPASVEP